MLEVFVFIWFVGFIGIKVYVNGVMEFSKYKFNMYFLGICGWCKMKIVVCLGCLMDFMFVLMIWMW